MSAPGNLHLRVPVGVAVIVRRGKRVLLGKRVGKHGAGMWAAPGGKPEPGEHPVQTAARELTEETGLVAGAFRPIPHWHYDRFDDHGLHFVTVYYEAIYCLGEPVLVEPDACEGWVWHRTDDLPAPLWAGLEGAVSVAW